MASMITTIDNPYDPRTNFEAWYMWDVGHGYNTSAYLDRVSSIAEEFPASIQEKDIENAIDEIISIHSGGMYIKLKIEDELEDDPTDSSAA